MLAKKNRLVKEKDFKETFRSGRSFFFKNLGIKAVKNKLEVNRYGIIISTKISKKAVERNKLKRQIRQIIKSLDKKTISGFDLIIITLPGVINRDYFEIKKELKDGFIKLKLLSKKNVNV